jgi:hypothetical protein
MTLYCTLYTEYNLRPRNDVILEFKCCLKIDVNVSEDQLLGGPTNKKRELHAIRPSVTVIPRDSLLASGTRKRIKKWEALVRPSTLV